MPFRIYQSRSFDGQTKCVPHAVTVTKVNQKWGKGTRPIRPFDEAGGFCCGALQACRGNDILNVAPFPGSLTHSVVPRCSLTICCTMGSPKPVPSIFVVLNS